MLRALWALGIASLLVALPAGGRFPAAAGGLPARAAPQLAGSATPDSPSTATGTTTPACPLAWNLVASPNVGSSGLYSVAVVAGDDVWAVGGAWIQHWDGTAWTISPRPSVLASNGYLNGVVALAHNDAWAVGVYTDSSNARRTLVLHWDGTVWSVSPSPSPNTPDGYVMLDSVAATASDDVWAVGTSQSGSNPQQPLMEHWDGARWSVIPGPSLSTGGGHLYAITALARDNVWATGPGFGPTLIEHWDGTLWSVIPSPSITPQRNVLHGVAASGPNDIWAVGAYQHDPLTQDSDGPLFEHWDGTAWRLVERSFTTVPMLPYAVVALAPDDVWAVGGYTTLGAHWDGISWRPSALPGRRPGYSLLEGVAAAGPADLWAVGVTAGSQVIVEHYAPRCPCTVSFSDVDAGNPFYASIGCLACQGIIAGYADGTFRPAQNVTRGQISKMAAAGADLGAPIPSGQQSFADVPPGHPFWVWIERLAAAGAISGYACSGPGEACDQQRRPYFRPGADVTRGQLAKIIANATELGGTFFGQPFSDVPPGSPFYEGISALAHWGVISGYGDGTFRPGNPATRGQTAKIVGRAVLPDCTP